MAAGLAAGCDSDSSTAVGDAGSAGEAPASAGKSSGSAGFVASDAGSPNATGGGADVAGAAGAADAGAAGMGGSIENAGGPGDADAGAAGTPVTSGGTGGAGGTGGSAGKSGGGGTGGAVATSGTSGVAGAGGAPPTLYIPASLTCASGNVLAAYSVCRNCHVSPPNAAYTVPFQLLTYADVKAQAADEYAYVSAGIMPLAGNFGAANTCSTNGALTCKQVLLNWLTGGAVGVTALNGICQ